MGKKKADIEFYVADTENSVPRSVIFDEHVEYEDPENTVRTDYDHTELTLGTRVWAAALCKTGADVGSDDVMIDTNIEAFLFRCSKLSQKSVIYFHNLAYDGPLILSALERMGYAQVERVKDPRTYSTLITPDGAWYKFEVQFINGRTIEFRDSLKLLPFSVDTIGASLKTKHRKLKGTIDYEKPRGVNYQPDATEIAYIENDVLVMAEAIAHLKAQPIDLTESITIGSACMKQFRMSLSGGDASMGKQLFDAMFPKIEDEADAAMRKSYRGGFCYVNDRSPYIMGNKAVEVTNPDLYGQVFDVNSLYPWAMYGKVFPKGDPMVLDPDKHLPDLSDVKAEYIVRVSALFKIKPDHIPFIQVKGGSRFSENEYVRSSGGEPVELTLTKPDWELFLEQYDLEYATVLDLWAFEPVTGIFDDYIDDFFKMKAEATNPVERMIAKLMLNNLYGKMAQAVPTEEGWPYLDDEGILRIMTVEADPDQTRKRRAGYIPIGAYITAYARGKTVRACQENFATFLYADTDSLHMLGMPTGIEIGQGLGEWDHEASWDMARFVRQKTYAERIIQEFDKGLAKDPALHVSMKAAGAPAEVKARLSHKLTRYVNGEWHHLRAVRDAEDAITAPARSDKEIIDRFTFGLREAGKLRRSSVPGGTVLIQSTFTIHVPEGVKIDPATGIAPTEWVVIS